MLKSVTLKDFQSHADTTLGFVPGINVVVGSSDSGKSAILRAINWVIRNKPSGDDYISHWGDTCQASLQTDNSKVPVDRIKGPKTNSYVLGEDEFKSFKQDVPEPITQVLNISDINIQYQLDAPFLLSETPGGVAQYLNETVNLGVIDSTLSNLNSMHREATSTLGTKQDHLVNLDRELLTLAHVEGMDVKLSRLEKLAQRTTLLKKTIENLSNLIRDAQDTQNELTSKQALLDFVPQVDELAVLYKSVSTTKERCDALYALTSDIQLSDNSIERHKSQVQKLKVSLQEQMPDVCPLCEQSIPK